MSAQHGLSVIVSCGSLCKLMELALVSGSTPRWFVKCLSSVWSGRLQLQCEQLFVDVVLDEGPCLAKSIPYDDDDDDDEDQLHKWEPKISELLSIT